MPPTTRVLDRRADGRRPRLSAVDREALPGALVLRRRRLARRLRALHPDPALRRHGTHDVHPLAERRRHSRVRPEEAGVPHRRQHADDARIDRPDDGPRSGDDARLRRLRRQHHVRQHLAAAPAQHQAARVRTAARVNARRSTRPRARAAAQPCRALPKAPALPPTHGVDASADATSRSRRIWRASRRDRPRRRRRTPASQSVVAFVCEDDVKQAIKRRPQDRDRRAHDRHAVGARSRPRRTGSSCRRLAATLEAASAMQSSALAG